MPVDAARGPTDLDFIDGRRIAEAEVEPRIAGRLVAPAAESLGDLTTPPARKQKRGRRSY